jgi:hypothetical protein
MGYPVGIGGFKKTQAVILTGVLQNELNIALPYEQNSDKVIFFGLKDNVVNPVFIVSDVADGSFEIPVTSVDYFVHSLKSYNVLKIAAIQLFYGYPALFGETFQNGIGHPKGRSRQPGQIPLPQGNLLFR